MIIIYEDDEIMDVIEYQKFTGKYKKLKSITALSREIKKIVSILRRVENVSSLKNYGALNYERLKYNFSGKSSIRLGYNSKYRLIFEEFDNDIKVNVIEISEHYGDK